MERAVAFSLRIWVWLIRPGTSIILMLLFFSLTDNSTVLILKMTIFTNCIPWCIYASNATQRSILNSGTHFIINCIFVDNGKICAHVWTQLYGPRWTLRMEWLLLGASLGMALEDMQWWKWSTWILPAEPRNVYRFLMLSTLRRRKSKYSFIHSLTRLFIVLHSLAHSNTHSFNSLTHSFTHSFTHSLIHSLLIAHSLTSFTHHSFLNWRLTLSIAAHRDRMRLLCIL